MTNIIDFGKAKLKHELEKQGCITTKDTTFNSPVDPKEYIVEHDTILNTNGNTLNNIIQHELINTEDDEIVRLTYHKSVGEYFVDLIDLETNEMYYSTQYDETTFELINYLFNSIKNEKEKIK